MIKVGITGGIGSGKSTLCRLLAERGAAVYDSDCEAKRLMNDSAPLREALTAAFGPACYEEAGLNRAWLARRVFQDPEALAVLNAIVHPAVRNDFRRWAAGQQAPYVILESALLFSAGFETEVDETVAVVAPEALRVERTCRRDGCTADEVRRRMAHQMPDEELVRRATRTVENAAADDLPKAAEALHDHFKNECRSATADPSASSQTA